MQQDMTSCIHSHDFRFIWFCSRRIIRQGLLIHKTTMFYAQWHKMVNTKKN